MKITRQKNGPAAIYRHDGDNGRQPREAIRPRRLSLDRKPRHLSPDRFGLLPMHSKIGVIFLGRRRPGFDMEWGRRMEERVRSWLQQTNLTVVEPPEKAIDDLSLRRAMLACETEKVDALVLLQTTMGDARLAP